MNEDMNEDMKGFEEVLWAALRGLSAVLLGMVVCAVQIALLGCDRGLKQENERLREELARQQQWVPLARDTIRDTVEVVTQQVVEVERIKEVLTAADRELLTDLGVQVKSLESLQKIGMRSEGAVTLSGSGLDGRASGAAYQTAGDTVTAEIGTRLACAPTDADSKSAEDTVLAYRDAWTEFVYRTSTRQLRFSLSDSLAIAVRREYKRRFLWWRWGVKGYEVKAVNFNPHSTIRYNTFVKRKE